MSKLLLSYSNREFRFFEPFKVVSPYHFYVIQFISFFYTIYRFASRNYAIYGLIPENFRDYPYQLGVELYPVPVTYFTTFQFIYRFIPFPSLETIAFIQYTIIFFAILGILGIFPKLCSWIVFLLALHITGMTISMTLVIDGAEILLSTLFIMAISPSGNFYSIKNGFNVSKRSSDYNWPIFLIYLFISGFYVFAGINKLLFVGLDFPLQLHLDYAATARLGNDALSIGSRYLNAPVAAFHADFPLFSIFGGLMTIIGEIGMISIFFLPRYRPFMVITMIGLHIFTFTLLGINFVGSSIILILCMDWNNFTHSMKIYYEPNNVRQTQLLRFVKRFDWFNRIQLLANPDAIPGPEGLIQRVFIAEVEDGSIYYGVDVLEQAMSRCLLLCPLSILLKMPFAIYLARYLYEFLFVKPDMVLQNQAVQIA